MLRRGAEPAAESAVQAAGDLLPLTIRYRTVVAGRVAVGEGDVADSAVVGLLAGLGLVGSGVPELSGDLTPAALASPLAVADCAVAAVGACLAAAAELGHARTGRFPTTGLDAGHVAAAVRSEAWVRDPSGSALGGFAALSRLWPAADGWVRTHANYPWHRRALLGAFGVADGPDAEVEALLAGSIGDRSAMEVEEIVYRAGGLAVAARRVSDWQATDAGRSVDHQPLIATEVLGPAAPLPKSGAMPASGLRVLDLTRVIAGPVGTRMLAALGAEVLRVDDPRRPELASQAVEGVIGKTSTLLDASTEQGAEALHELLDRADVLVTGYRPGALRAFGLEPDQVSARHSGTVVVTLSAWGTTGPWATRRGFDSLVQIASGIGWAVSRDGDRPGTLPCQLLDHATGYLIAAGALAALTRRARHGQASHVHLSLARTAKWLIDHGPRDDPRPATSNEADIASYRVPFGNGWTGIGPPGVIDGRALTWPHLPPEYGQAPPRWT
jgi:CoA-transferase family III